ncbi:methyltransferase domain-containing protein [Tropicimonas sp.]|uniref:methyltransferase domain-containing protein n=1 Tax=Tropicimonas sp. TaxID=2067044 RepID=UPI003A83AE42
MYLDVLDLRNFYYKTRLGRVAQRAIRDQLLLFWPVEAVRSQTLAGFGFTLPLMRPFLGSARRVIAMMPAQQGVMPWPLGQPNVSVLVEETMWPLETGSVDRMLLMHGLDSTDNLTEVLSECYRVLGPGGRAIVVVPNRSGLWARRDVTPFGYGQPFSYGQLEAVLLRHSFQPERHVAALFGPPSEKRFWLRSAGLLERYGGRISSSLAGGVFIVEVSKVLQTPGGAAVREVARLPLRVLEGVPGSGAEPAGV